MFLKKCSKNIKTYVLIFRQNYETEKMWEIKYMIYFLPAIAFFGIAIYNLKYGKAHGSWIFGEKTYKRDHDFDNSKFWAITILDIIIALIFCLIGIYYLIR